MVYSVKIEESIDALSGRWKGLEKKKMFGGICYLLKGNMCFGINKDFLIVRLGTDEAASRMKERSVRPFDITGRPMKGWVMVSRGGWQNPEDMKRWLEAGKAYASALPPK